MLLIREGENCVEMKVVDRAPIHLPTSSDVKLSVALSSYNFTGQGFAWVDASTFTTFLQQLRELELRRQGKAAMNGISPGVFQFRIWSIVQSGHMAIAGMIAKQIHEGVVGPYQHSVEIGFEIDPTLLPKIVAGFQEIAEGPVSGN